MPIASPQQYAAMLDAAQQGDYAYPAVNVTSIVTINAALKAFADAKSDGIIQFSTGGGQFASGLNVKDAVHGCIVLAAYPGSRIPWYTGTAVWHSAGVGMVFGYP